MIYKRNQEDSEVKLLSNLICGISTCICIWYVNEINLFGNQSLLIFGIIMLPFLYVITSESIYQMFRRY